MAKERGGLWPPSLDGYGRGSILSFSIFFLCTLISLLLDTSSFLSVTVDGVFSHCGLMEGNDHFGCILLVTICAVLVLLCIFTLFEDGGDPCYVHFVCFPGLPFYWIWLNLGYIGLHRLFDLAVIIAAVIVPWKTVAIILVYMYGVFASLLWTDTCNTTRGTNVLRLLVSCVLMAFICFKHLLIA